MIEIIDSQIFSDVVDATATMRLGASAEGPGSVGEAWLVSWLPTRIFDVDSATTAMMLAELYAEGLNSPKRRALAQAWHEELGVSMEHTYDATELEAKRSRQECLQQRGTESVRLRRRMARVAAKEARLVMVEQGLPAEFVWEVEFGDDDRADDVDTEDLVYQPMQVRGRVGAEYNAGQIEEILALYASAFGTEVQREVIEETATGAKITRASVEGVIDGVEVMVGGVVASE